MAAVVINPPGEESDLSRSTRPLIATVLVVLAGLLCVAGCTSSPSSPSSPLPSPASTNARPPSPRHPNIVYILTDDLSWDLVKFMPHVQALQQQGMTFSNYTVTDSLCCPSRASIFTGDYPHNTHVLGNTLPDGGYGKFTAEGLDHSTFATSLLAAGYRTGFMGKYLNQYEPDTSELAKRHPTAGAYVPPGWSTWDGVGSGGYPGYGYGLADGHKILQYGHSPRDFINTVLQHKATAFVASASRHRNPFFLEVATFSPHYPYAVAPADVGTFSGIQQPHLANFNKLPHPAPLWLKARHLLSRKSLRAIRKWFELRVEAVQSVDRMIGAIEHSVQKAGQMNNTVFVFNSDNGLHLGQYTLESGKQTAFDCDIRVPLIMAGPGIKPGSVNTDMAQNIDLRPTFDQLAGAKTPSNVDGRSLVPLLDGQPSEWRSYALIEHAHDDPNTKDPDSQTYLSGIPPTYTAIRSKTFVFVRYKTTGDIEYYDIAKDPLEMHNLGPSLPTARRDQLNQIMNRLIACHGSSSCWAAGVPASG